MSCSYKGAPPFVKVTQGGCLLTKLAQRVIGSSVFLFQPAVYAFWRRFTRVLRHPSSVSKRIHHGRFHIEIKSRPFPCHTIVYRADRLIGAPCFLPRYRECLPERRHCRIESAAWNDAPLVYPLIPITNAYWIFVVRFDSYDIRVQSGVSPEQM